MKSKRISFKVDVDLDFGFWAILPAININRQSNSLEFEWLCLGVYISKIHENDHDQR